MQTESTNSTKRLAPATLLAAIAAASLGSTAFAGPIWDDDLSEDAGASVLGAQEIVSGGSILQIVGSVGPGSLLGGADSADMYLVRITQPTTLSISTAGGDRGGFASFDSALFLFRAVQSANGTYSAEALLANNDADDGANGSFIGSAANDGSGFSITESGLYYIMITTAGLTPQSASGSALWQGLDSAGTIAFGGAQAFDAVAGDPTASGGSYSIRLTGVSGIPAPGALALLSLAGIRAGRRRRG
ncbi:MAG: hypothetical protein ACK5WD_06750 [bacterium]|jgi:hypothetical protein